MPNNEVHIVTFADYDEHQIVKVFRSHAAAERDKDRRDKEHEKRNKKHGVTGGGYYVETYEVF
jgi:hypothetical protein